MKNWMRIIKTMALSVAFGYSVPVVAQRADYFGGKEPTDALLEPLLRIPPQYQAIRTREKMQIDGKADEAIWSRVPAIGPLVEIQGAAGAPQRNSSVKLCWDDEYLYLFAQLEEAHLWATLKDHDATVFMDHALEIFIDPDGDMYNYLELQINAYETIWELTMEKAYRNGGKSNSGFDIPGLKKAVRLRGTLNQPADRDEGWDVEMAIPLAELKALMPSTRLNGQTWRVNFSQVSWELEVENGKYQKIKGSGGRPNQPQYFVWSPQGRVDLHMPERWGILGFVEEAERHPPVTTREQEQHRLLWKYYYLQMDYRLKKQQFAGSLKVLKDAYPSVRFDEPYTIKMEPQQNGFILEVRDRENSWQLNSAGELRKTNF
jgi:hypothetical protein